jgi:hypothetical protein
VASDIRRAIVIVGDKIMQLLKAMRRQQLGGHLGES